MSFSPFNHYPKKRRAPAKTATHTDDGSPLYSDQETPGTLRAVKVTGLHLVAGPTGARIVRASPMPIPPNRMGR